MRYERLTLDRLFDSALRLFDLHPTRSQTGITLRPYLQSDIEAMFALDQLCFSADFRFDRRSMRRYSEAHNALVVVAQVHDDTLAGFAIAHLEGSRADTYGYVVTLDVAPASRRKGLAADLLGTLERRARAAGANRMELHVSTENHAAIRFYERTGYQRSSRQENFYGDGLDGLSYTKPLH